METKQHAVKQSLKKSEEIKKHLETEDFPGGPVVKTLHFTEEGAGLIPGLRTKISHAVWHGQKIKIRVCRPLLSSIYLKKKKKKHNDPKPMGHSKSNSKRGIYHNTILPQEISLRQRSLTLKATKERTNKTQS